MRYGYFDDASREYVITTLNTPYPWINYLGNQDFFSLFSNTAGGYSFFKDARTRRITRYRYNNIPYDREGKFFFLHDEESFWNIGGKPANTLLDSYECRHGLGYSRITSEKNNIKAEQLAFVPQDHACEIEMITITNLSGNTRQLCLTSYLEWAFWDAYDDMTNFQRNLSIGEIEVESSTIYHKTEYRERRNHYAFYHAYAKIDGFDTDRETFLGLGGDIANPEAIRKNISFQSLADGWSPIASHRIKMTLTPGESRTMVFMLGYAENNINEKFDQDGRLNKVAAQKMISAFSTIKAVKDAFLKLKKFWEKRIFALQIHTSDERLNRMVNIWNPYQNAICFAFSRSASYFESGVSRGMGFRDSNQDLLGFMHMEPEKSRQRILDLASTMFENGGAFHQYSPLTKKGNENVGVDFNDDSSWMILSVVQYIKETGDYAILDEIIPYNSDPLRKGSLLEHLEKAFAFTLVRLGPHGLPLIGRADWNDCLNLNCFSAEPGESFQTVHNKGNGQVAESIFIAGLFVFVGKKYAELLDKIEQQDKADKARAAIMAMETNVIASGFDGEWFLRAYDANGNKVGSITNDEGKIFIESQGICAMAGIGKEEGLTIKALGSSHRYLDTKYGMVLNWPAYSRYRLELGEISSYPQGYKENGGIFCHNNTWIICAEALNNRKDQAFETYKKITPAYLEDQSDIHRTEPYVYAQMIAGKEAKRFGEAKNSWLTGTASWSYVAITQYILGIHPDFDGLRINPVVPDSLSSFYIKRRFRSVTYHIHAKKDAKQKPSVFLDGTLCKEGLVPYDPIRKEQNIDIYL